MIGHLAILTKSWLSSPKSAHADSYNSFTCVSMDKDMLIYTFYQIIKRV